MGLYYLKFPFRKILLPLAKKLRWLNPDWLGYLATIVALGTMFCYLNAQDRPWLLLLSIALTLFRMTLNTIDGVIALERGNLRLRGQIVNALPDRYSDIFILLGIGLSPLCAPPWGMLGLASVFLVSYTGMLGKAIGGTWQIQGPLGKVERLVFIMVFSLLQYLQLTGDIDDIYGWTYFECLMILFVVLSQVTVYNRLRGQLKECAKSDWIKYRILDKKSIVVYDSMTGNTEIAANEIAAALGCDCNKASGPGSPDWNEFNWSEYDLVVFATPNLRKKPIASIQKIIESSPSINQYALVITSGMPVWSVVSGWLLQRFFIRTLGKRPTAVINIKGFHAKYHTFAGHPNEGDLLNAYVWAIKLYNRLRRN